MKMENKKNTSFELMRIVSMIMICAYHWQLHGYNDGIVSSEFCTNQIFSFVFGSWGVLGVNLFFLLSFYFLTQKNEINYDRIIQLMIKTSFYGTATLIAGIFMGAVSFNIIELLKSVMGVLAYQYWFITVYIIVVLLSPLLNDILKKRSNEECYFLLLFGIYITYFLGWTVGSELIGRLSCGITIYILIYTLENKVKFNIFEKYRWFAIILLIGGIFFEIILSYLGNNYNPIFFKIIGKLQTTNSPYMLLLSIFVFYIFKNLKIGSNKFIVFMGKYSAGAYLLHGGAGFIKDFLWDDVFKAGVYYERPPINYVSHYVFCILILFLLGVICEIIYANTVSVFVKKCIKKVSLTH
ncbi:MAG: acyltransferase family protein [Lachnospiraceae bacterium]